ncbi:unnamed protein product [Danaus chrysippus]|uniref:(African queen) hypothetical protein n=1 Tax=Danaus chrysippus TaxID=151541 RepID=A0A8J2QUY6_9NEOP|nr:unnamed protein product [Danaus chrysippus]
MQHFGGAQSGRCAEAREGYAILANNLTFQISLLRHNQLITNFEYARSKTDGCQSGWAFSRMPRHATERRGMPQHAAGCHYTTCRAMLCHAVSERRP